MRVSGPSNSQNSACSIIHALSQKLACLPTLRSRIDQGVGGITMGDIVPCSPCDLPLAWPARQAHRFRVWTAGDPPPQYRHALADRGRDLLAAAATGPPVQDGDGHPAAGEDDGDHDAAGRGAPDRVEHDGEPEGPDEAPGLADDADEDANARGMLDVAIDGVGNEDRGGDLVADRADGDADDGRDVPVAVRRLLDADAEHQHPDHGEQKAGIAEPETVLGRRLRLDLPGSSVDPEVAQAASELLADDRADDAT
nr:hypothetical protein CFP56_09217 [Quercus suber]